MQYCSDAENEHLTFTQKINETGDHHRGALDENDPHRLPNLNIWLPVGEPVGDVQEVRPEWRKSVTEAVFECKNASLA